jgi:hypothetical protein
MTRSHSLRSGAHDECAALESQTDLLAEPSPELHCRDPSRPFRIVPSDFLPLDELMNGRNVHADGYEVHFSRRGHQTGILSRKFGTIEQAKDFARWRYEFDQHQEAKDGR